MKIQEMKYLIEKYFNGETTPEEESKVINYFAGKDIDPIFLSDKEYFDFLANEKKQLLDNEDLTEAIWNNIEKSELKRSKNNFQLNKISKVILAIAASIVITLIVGTLFKYEFTTRNNTPYFSDTYDDPELAYQEAKKALLFISEKLNKGTDPMENLKSFEKGTKNLGLIDNLDKGLMELKPVKSIEKVDKYIK